MKIGEQEYKELIITDAEGNLLISISDENIIISDECNIMGVQIDD